jgi:hypothetical protein
MPVGLFVAVWHLVEREVLPEPEAKAYWQARARLETVLPIPPIYQDGNSAGAVTWFKANGVTPVLEGAMRFYLQTMQRHQRRVVKVELPNPGRLVYEDPYQVAAIPDAFVIDFAKARLTD